MLFKQCAVDVRLVTETACHHVPRVDTHVHPQSSERRVATPARVADVRPIRFRDGSDRLAVLVRVCFHRMLAEVAAFRKRLLANAASEPLSGDRDAGMLHCHVLAELDLVDERAPTQVTQVRFFPNMSLVVPVQIRSLREAASAAITLERFLSRM